MKKFLIRLVFLLLPFLLAFLYMEYYCRNNTSLGYKKKYIEAHLDSAQILLLGSSHIQDGVNASILGKPAINMAFGGQTMAIDYFLLEKYVARAPQLKWLLLDVSPHRFYLELIKNDWNHRIYRVMFGIDYMTQDMTIDNYSLVLSGFDYFSKVVWQGVNPWHKKVQMNDHGFPLGDIPDRFSKLNYDSSEASKTWSMYYYFTDSVQYQKNVNWLDKTIALAKKHNIKVLLLNPPVYSTFYKTIPENSISITQALIQQRVQQNAHVGYLDLMKSQHFQFRDFRNDNHLNVKGASKLTSILDSVFKE